MDFFSFGRKWCFRKNMMIISEKWHFSSFTDSRVTEAMLPSQKTNESSIPRSKRPWSKGLNSHHFEGRHGGISPITSMMIFFVVPDVPLKNCKSCGQRYVQARQRVQCLCLSTSPVRLEGLRTSIVNGKLALKMLEV